jgi:hypothetical protein
MDAIRADDCRVKYGNKASDYGRKLRNRYSLFLSELSFVSADSQKTYFEIKIWVYNVGQIPNGGARYG